MSMERTSKPLMIVGCGDTGRRLLAAWLSAAPSDPGRILLHCGSESSAQALRAKGYQVWQQDLDEVDASLRAIADLGPGGSLVWLAPPPRAGVTDPRLDHYLPRLLADGGFTRLIYASTTGVYGSAARGWIDETAPTRPDTDRGRRRLAAELSARQYGQALGVEVIVARIAAIYGPDRLPIRRLKAGQSLPRDLADRLTNRIHADDLARGLLRALLHGQDGAIYHMADGAPAAFGDYLDACADSLRLPRLPRIDAPSGAGAAAPDPARDFLSVDRRIDNRRLIEELGLVLQFPDFKQGIQASVTGSRIQGKSAARD